jgi:hypothetical protein
MTSQKSKSKCLKNKKKVLYKRFKLKNWQRRLKKKNKVYLNLL